MKGKKFTKKHSFAHLLHDITSEQVNFAKKFLFEKFLKNQPLLIILLLYKFFLKKKFRKGINAEKPIHDFNHDVQI